jgi:Uma2 family endonuclease
MSQTASLPEPTLLEPPVDEQAMDQPINGARRFPCQGEWTYEDWLNLPDDGWKYEIIDGVLYMSPPPLIDHQDVVSELLTAMRTQARRRNLGKVLTAPCGVRLPGQRVPVEPDIFFVKRERLRILKKRYVEGAPDLIVEVLSPSNANYDLETKFILYQNAGVQECWFVIPWERIVRIYNLRQGLYHLTGEYKAGDIAKSTVLTGFKIAVQTLFEFESEIESDDV